MKKLTLWLIGISYISNALVMWPAPHYWYETVPGKTMTGPFNLYFIRDIDLAYLVSGTGPILSAA